MVISASGKQVLMTMQSESPTGLPEFAPQRLGSAQILVAEDPFVGTFLRTVLQRHGYKVVTGEATRASELLRQRTLTPDIVITNQPSVFLEFAGTLPMLYIAASPDHQLAAQFSV